MNAYTELLRAIVVHRVDFNASGGGARGFGGDGDTEMREGLQVCARARRRPRPRAHACRAPLPPPWG